MNGLVKFRQIYYIYFVTFSVNLMTFLSGQGQAWSSPCIPKLLGEVDPETNPLGRPATIQEISWITSLHNLGAIACIPFCAMIANKFGKKRTLIFFGILQMLSNIILTFANNAVYFYIARILIGAGTGCAFTLVQPYVVEIVEVGHRGRAFSCTYWMAALGMESVFLIGPSVTIRTLALISLIPSIVFMACFGKFSTESASYFVRKSDMQNAEVILKKTRLEEDGVADELLHLITVFTGDSGNSFRQMLRTKGIYKCFLFAAILMFLQQAVGISCLISYQQSLLAEYKTPLSADKVVMINGFLQFIPMLLVTKIIDRWGRKTIITMSYIGQGLSILCLAIYYQLQKYDIDLSSLNWLPIALLLTYSFSFKFGSGPLTILICIELLPQNYMITLYSGISLVSNLFTFLIVYIFPTIWHKIGLDVAFYGFTIASVIAIIFIVVFIPETKGKTFDQIQRKLKKIDDDEP